MIIAILETDFNKDKKLCCATCGNVVTSTKSLYKVPGAEGEVGAYVNPHGYFELYFSNFMAIFQFLACISSF